MAFCGNYGTQVSDGTKFCPNCGSPVGVARQQNYQASQQSYQLPQQAYQTPHPQPAKCTIDGDPIDLDVEVVCDGKRWAGSWEPTAEYYQQYLEDLWDETFTE